MQTIRRPAVAGQFYPADPAELRAIVGDLLRQAAAPSASDDAVAVRAIIAPHASYAFSGPIAASAYAHVAALSPRRVVLLGPAHRAPLQGLGLSSARAFATPLGHVPLDRSAHEALLDFPFVQIHDEAHAPEHGLEVHLPFLQHLFTDFQLLPIVAGPCPPGDLSAALRPFAEDPQTLIVVSSDLSHFYAYEQAQQLDRRTAQRIEALQPLAADAACGRYAINGLLHLARDQVWRAHTVDLRNSGDTGGPHDRVVGYGAFLFEEFTRQ